MLEFCADGEMLYKTSYVLQALIVKVATAMMI